MRVFYDPRQSAGNAADAFSPSAQKPAMLVRRWLDAHLIAPSEVLPPAPVAEAEILRVHEPEYVRGVLGCHRNNGFGNRLESIARSLPWTTGSMCSAARHAWLTGDAGVSPSSGFHHAGYRFGGAFCTFNGLMVAAAELHAQGAPRIGILDLDAHYGDGTDDILEQLGIGWVEHYTFGADRVRPEGAAEWLEGLPSIVARFSGCAVVLYQAGADPHLDDPLGGVLSTEQMRRRDALVFEGLAALAVPVAWNLAGGYQQPIEKVLALHDATLIECRRVYG